MKDKHSLVPAPGGVRHRLTDEWLKDNNVYKVPQMVYQIMCDAVCTSRQDISGRWEEDTGSVQRVRKILEDYVADRHPGMVLNGFIDLNNANVAELTKQGIYGLSWGIYYTVRHAEGTNDISLLTDITKLLT